MPEWIELLYRPKGGRDHRGLVTDVTENARTLKSSDFGFEEE